MARPFVTGADVRALDQGAGPAVLVVHGGLDDGATWQRVADALEARHRVVRLHRRQYRDDLAGPCTVAQEAADVVALAEAIGEPVLLVGHSSGGVVALEALVASPARFAGAALYEPVVHTRPGEWDTPLARARAARTTVGAMAVFLRDIVRVPAWQAYGAALAIAAVPRMRRFAPHQLDDARAVADLGVRLDAYAGIAQPVVLIGGSRSPAHLGARIRALEAVLPRARTVVLDGQGHGAHLGAPQRLAAVIGEHAAAVLHEPRG
ncbi:alpha/beta fold hydrolase [Pseudonocardia sp. CA-107938]|uniref:alpha/beta fold hydrolase n=1 Tax=Pseudonocardia sp. CA-107938 TaxID=3240021 RepID=UPI003D8A9A1B